LGGDIIDRTASQAKRSLSLESPLISRRLCVLCNASVEFTVRIGEVYFDCDLTLRECGETVIILSRCYRLPVIVSGTVVVD